MPVTASIRFTQAAPGPGIGPDGEALVGVAGTSVLCENVDNTDVDTHEWTMESVDHESAVPVGLLGNTSTVNFTPDVPGSYKVKVSLVGTDGSTDEDEKVFSVPHPGRDYINPAFRGIAAHHNYSGQARGWAGTASPRLLDVMLRDLSYYFGALPQTPAQLTANVDDYAPVDATDAFLTFARTHLIRLDSDAARSISGFDVALAGVRRKTLVNVGSFPVDLLHDDAGSVAENRILIPGGATLSLAATNDIVQVVYDEVSERWRAVVPP